MVGYTHETMSSGGGDAYHVLSASGEGRGGVTAHLPGGVAPHWLPYVMTADPDATVARARRLGAAIPVPAMDIPASGASR